MKLPHRTPEDSISLPPGVDFRDPEYIHAEKLQGHAERLAAFNEIIEESFLRGSSAFQVKYVPWRDVHQRESEQ